MKIFLIMTLAAFYHINSVDAVGGFLCGPILTGITKAVDSALPVDIKPKCKCAAKADSFLEWVTMRFYFDVACSAKLCIEDLAAVPGLEELADLPIVGNYCVEPTGGAKINPLNKRETIACSGSSTLVINVTKLEEMTGRNISDQTEMPFPVPNTCITLEHKATMTKLESCAMTMDGKNCPCTVCAEGAGIQLSCPGLIDEYLLEELDQVLNQTERCISANMMAPPTSGNAFFSFLDYLKPTPKL